MIELLDQPERIDLWRADDPRDVVHRVVASLAQGGVVGLSTETGYAVCAGALHPGAVGALNAPEPAADGAGRPTLLLKGPGELSDWIPGVGELGRRLARRAWPGAVVLRFDDPAGAGLAARLANPVRDVLLRDRTLAFRIPAQGFMREVLRLLPGPMMMLPARGGERERARTADEIAGWRPPGLGLIVDEGPARLDAGPTVVHVRDETWRVVAPGAVSEASLTRLAGTILLFVCTGNTCRSPMAEALCKVLLAERLGCSIDALEQRGYVVLSAGMAASQGMPAAAHAVEVVDRRGGSLREHRSQQITADLVRHADHVIALTNDHLDALLEQVPEAAASTRLLHPGRGDVPDPVGMDRETYQRTARAIEEFLGRLLDDLGIGTASPTA